jgi:hypothetical protein
MHQYLIEPIVSSKMAHITDDKAGVLAASFFTFRTQIGRTRNGTSGLLRNKHLK